MSSAIAAAESIWVLPYRGKVGMACLIAAESAIFTIFVVAYLFYIGKSLSGPTPKRSSGGADLLFRLFAEQQFDYSPRGEIAIAREVPTLSVAVVLDHLIGRIVPVRHRA